MPGPVMALSYHRRYGIPDSGGYGGGGSLRRGVDGPHCARVQARLLCPEVRPPRMARAGGSHRGRYARSRDGSPREPRANPLRAQDTTLYTSLALSNYPSTPPWAILAPLG